MFYNWSEVWFWLAGFVFVGALVWLMWPLITHMFEIVWAR